MSKGTPEGRDFLAGLRAVLSAVRISFLNQPLDYYPRFSRTIPCLGRTVDAIKPESILKRLNDPSVMGAWNTLNIAGPELEKAIELAKASLDEVKAQTEYQDQKATRLLTVSTFLTALAGAFFVNFSTEYPLKTLSQQSNVDWSILVAVYLSFSMFVILSIAGALVTFHATRTRFKYSSEEKLDGIHVKTKSYLFYREIIRTTPEGWASSFVTVNSPAGTARINHNLKVQYLKNYVSETYLIAAKTAEKIRLLEPAQSLLSFALRCLALYLALLAYVLTTLDSTKPAAVPMEVRFIAPQAHSDLQAEHSPHPTKMLQSDSEVHP